MSPDAEALRFAVLVLAGSGAALVAVQSHRLTADDASWVSGLAPAAGTLSAKSRYRQTDSSCLLSDGANAAFELRFDKAQWAATPGQSAVLYGGEVCLGGGVIASAV